MSSDLFLHMIAGFLGVGKTTTILHLIEQIRERESIAVVVNERGDVGLDGAIIDSETPGLKIREVAGGCICCTAGPALANALVEIVERFSPDRIFIEPSGIAKPGELRDLVAGLKAGARIHPMPVITLVDPAQFVEGKLMDLPVYRDQVEAADILVANRCDLVDAQILDRFLHKAKTLFPPKRAVLTTRFGRLPERLLFQPPTAPDRPGRPPPPASDTAAVSSDGAETEASAHTHFHGTGWTWSPSTRFGYDRLCRTFDFMREMPGIERVKGIFHTDRGWSLMELAGGSFYERKTQYRGDSRCQVVMSTDRPDLLERIGRRIQASQRT